MLYILSFYSHYTIKLKSPNNHIRLLDTFIHWQCDTHSDLDSRSFMRIWDTGNNSKHRQYRHSRQKEVQYKFVFLSIPWPNGQILRCVLCVWSVKVCVVELVVDCSILILLSYHTKSNIITLKFKRKTTDCQSKNNKSRQIVFITNTIKTSETSNLLSYPW